MTNSSDLKAGRNDVEIRDPISEIGIIPPIQSSQDIELVAFDEADPEPVKVRSKLRLTAIMSGLYLAMFIVALDQTIVATSIPTITHDLKSSSGYVWIGGAYLLSNAASGPIWAKLSDIFGRKPIFLAADALFFASSVFCAKAGSMKVLIIGRTFQGVACGGLIPLIMITISDLFSIRARSLYIGIMELVWVVAGGVGPVLGGVFTERVSWRWNFWINLPISGTTFILLFIYLDVHNPKTPVLDGLKAIDWFGSLSIIGLVLMVLLGLEFGGASVPWNSPRVICLIVFGALMSIAFIYSEKRLAKYPLMPLKLFANKSNAASLLVTLWHGMIYIGGEYYLPLYFQSVKGSSPLTSGLLVMPITTTEAITGILAGVIIHSTGRYLEMIYIGVTFMTIGNGLYILLSPASTLAEIIIYQIVAGIGAGLLFQAPLIALQALVSQDETATATATFGFVRSLATALGVVLGGVIFQNSMDMHIPPLASPPINLPSNVTDLLTKGGAAANVMLSNTITDAVQKEAVRGAYAWSMRNMWIFYTGLSALAMLSSVFIKRHYLRSDHVETRTGIKKREGT
ncbi:putative MFS transporter [Stipitochalara longipes BDJ]|nr:putative MFS transporter [Stipitochalara longipes BDJ]